MMRSTAPSYRPLRKLSANEIVCAATSGTTIAIDIARRTPSAVRMKPTANGRFMRRHDVMRATSGSTRYASANAINNGTVTVRIA